MKRRNRQRLITNSIAYPLTARTRARDAMAATHRPSWYRIANFGNNASKTATVELYSEIGMWGVTAEDFTKDLASIKGDVIDLRINSEGGEVFDGITIFNALRNHPATVNVTVDGLAASAASFIAMAGDKITMGRGSQMMIHDAQTVAMGNSADMRKTADLLDKVSDTIASFYAERAGGSVTDWRAVMTGERWYSAEEAVEAGLADECVSAKLDKDQDESGAGRATASADDSHKIVAIADAAPDSSCADDSVDDPAEVEPLVLVDFDPDMFRASVRAGTAPPPSALTPDLFRAAITLGVTDIGAPVRAAKTPEPAEVEPMRVDPDLFRRALREAKL